MSTEKNLEPLYLDKNYDGKEILIPGTHAIKLRQLERDGLRFLYRHFKKKSLGVINNDPMSNGKLIQEVLFLQSLQHVLNQSYPCLIITNNINMVLWKHIFQLFYENYDNDIILEPTNIYDNKRIFICQSTNMISYSQRKWSIIIIDECDNIVKPKSYMSDLNLFKADFKVWNSSLNIAKELEKLKIIYKYIYKDVLDTEYLTKIRFAHMMNIITEFCLTRDSPDDEHMILDIDKEPLVTNKYPISKKNKDPTGTKVKSSKKRKVGDEKDSKNATKDFLQEIGFASSNLYTTTKPQEDTIQCDNTRINNNYFIINHKESYSIKNYKVVPNFSVLMHKITKVDNCNIIRANFQCKIENNFQTHDIKPIINMEVDCKDSSQNHTAELDNNFNKLHNQIVNEDVFVYNHKENKNIKAPLNREINTIDTKNNSESLCNGIIENKIDEHKDVKINVSDKSEEQNKAGNDLILPSSIDISTDNELNLSPINNVNSEKVSVSKKSSKSVEEVEEDEMEIIGDKSMYEKILNQFF